MNDVCLFSVTWLQANLLEYVEHTSNIATWKIFIWVILSVNNLRPSKRNSTQCCTSASLPFPWTRGCSTNQYAEHPL